MLTRCPAAMKFRETPCSYGIFGVPFNEVNQAGDHTHHFLIISKHQSNIYEVPDADLRI